MSSVGERRLGRLVASVAAIVVLISGTAAGTSAEAVTSGATNTPPDKGRNQEESTWVQETGIAAEDRPALIGEEGPATNDVAYTTLGGPDGVAVLRAGAEDGYEWKRIAELPAHHVDTDLWVANSCMDPTSKYMAVVYAPRAFTNDEGNFLGGAWGALVELETGTVTDLGRGHSMAHFNPGCGAGAFAAFARYEVDGTTQLASVDLRNGKAAFKVDVEGQVTSPVTMNDGSLVAVANSGVVQIDASGVGRVIAGPRGLPFGLRVDSRERLAYLTMESPDRSTAQMIDLHARDGRKRALGAGPLAEVGLERTGDKFYVFGPTEAPRKRPNDVEYVLEGAPHAEISARGSLIVNSVAPAGMGDPQSDDPSEVRPKINAWVPATETRLDFLVDPSNDAAAMTSSGDELTVQSEDEPRTAPAFLDVRPIGSAPSGVLRAGSPTNPVEDERTCAVPRNDPHNQAYQPKPRQVQWAVDRAVRGELTEPRPLNWRNLGMPAYTPQGLFPRVNLTGGGTIPPQIMLGILAQESNLWQASRYTAPGSTGNPLIGDFYGSRPEEGGPDSVLWNIKFAEADCGYGVGQITDGMRLAGRERPDEVALPYDSQRAIALDYAANVAMAVRMLGQKWNEVKAAGMDINNGDPERIENWFFAVWAYNSGLHPNEGSGPWGVGWFNNPINPIYPANRGPFLDGDPSHAASPQLWPYPEKVLGFAAHTLDLPQTVMADVASRSYPTNYVSAFTTAWWPGDNPGDADQNRWEVKPPIATFCSLNQNDCDPMAGFPCTLTGEPECWWHTDAVWKADCEWTCGYGEERFDSSYSTEASAMGSHLPEITRQLSFPPNCQAPPSGVLVVDNVTHQPVRSECSRRATQGSFQLQFVSPDANGNYSSKVDLHQQGGGYNGHFYWSHMRTSPDMDPVHNINNRLKITGRWSLGQTLNQWTRVWVHLPDHAAWTEQAAYTIELGNGQTRTRYLPQRRYENAWIPLGVFRMNGVPAVSLSNIATVPRGSNTDDVAWDAVGFQPLASKPTDFVVALGDSYSSGEGAGDYSAWSDHDGNDNSIRNACHQSKDAWIRKLSLPSSGSPTIGARESSNDASLDFHFLACSGAQTEHTLPFYTSGAPVPVNAENQFGAGQWGQVSQLDAGYLDENTTLVTLSVGGNDMRFPNVIQTCVAAQGYCGDEVLDGDVDPAYISSMSRLDTQLPSSLGTVLEQIKLKAPNATIVLVGYPRLFDSGSACMLISIQNQGWLNTVADELTQVMSAAASAANQPGHRVVFVDPQPAFQGRTLCTTNSAIWAIQPILTAGDAPWGIFEGQQVASAESGHPNDAGAVLYSVAVQTAINGLFP